MVGRVASTLYFQRYIRILVYTETLESTPPTSHFTHCVRGRMGMMVMVMKVLVLLFSGVDGWVARRLGQTSRTLVLTAGRLLGFVAEVGIPMLNKYILYKCILICCY